MRGLISSKQNFVDCSKPDICETVDIHSEVPRHVETVCTLGNINRKPDDVIKKVTVDVDKMHEILDKEKAEREMKESSE